MSRSIERKRERWLLPGERLRNWEKRGCTRTQIEKWLSRNWERITSVPQLKKKLAGEAVRREGG